jgi:hypothetical protein
MGEEMNKLKRSGGELYNWSVEPLFYNGIYTELYPEALVQEDEHGKYVFRIIGSVRDDSCWGNERIFHTSLVVNITDEYVETLNTIYKLGKKREDV